MTKYDRVWLLAAVTVKFTYKPKQRTSRIDGPLLMTTELVTWNVPL